MQRLVATLSALLLALGGFGLAGCGGDGDGERGENKGPGVVEEAPPQPTTGSQGTKQPTPTPTTTAPTTSG